MGEGSPRGVLPHSRPIHACSADSYSRSAAAAEVEAEALTLLAEVLEARGETEEAAALRE